MARKKEMKKCYICEKETLNRMEIGLNYKLLDDRATRFYCLDCLAAYLEVDAEFLLAKVEEFKEQACIYFQEV